MAFNRETEIDVMQIYLERSSSVIIVNLISNFLFFCIIRMRN